MLFPIAIGVNIKPSPLTAYKNVFIDSNFKLKYCDKRTSICAKIIEVPEPERNNIKSKF